MSALGSRVRVAAQRALVGLSALNDRIDRARAFRDRANHHEGTVDSGYWIHLR